MPPAYTLVRSKRKTMSLQVTRDLEVVVRAPRRTPRREIDAFVGAHSEWIEEHLHSMRARKEKYPEPSEQEIEFLKMQARAYIPQRVEYYAWKMGLDPTGLKITSARTRFGSCSSRDSLCFSYILMRYPIEAIDYVVVHELAHIVHKNHSRAFYALVEQHMPDYRRRRAMLKS